MQQALNQLQEEVQRKRMYNGQRFMGGYTEPAKRDYDNEEKRIAEYEERRKKEIQENYKNHKETPLQPNKYGLPSVKRNTARNFSSSPGIPCVGGYAAVHAASHGGGFNHPGFYGSPFQ
jgi:hypothetical protein